MKTSNKLLIGLFSVIVVTMMVVTVIFANLVDKFKPNENNVNNKNSKTESVQIIIENDTVVIDTIARNQVK
jgi:hypothetical protein